MVSRDFETLSARRIARARLLSGRYLASREVLDFFAELATFQRSIFPQVRERAALLAFHAPLVGLIRRIGPRPMRERASILSESSLRRALEDYWSQVDTCSPDSLFARVLLQPHAIKMDPEPGAVSPDRCPRCGHRPQVSVLRPEGHGKGLTLVCSLCLYEWGFSRGKCAACGEDEDKGMSYYAASGFDHIQVVTCDACRTYLHSIDLSREIAAVPDVDELAALPLDIWAQQQGFRKLQPNFVGI